MTEQIVVIIISVILSALGFFLVKWIHGIEKSYDKLVTLFQQLKTSSDDFSHRITQLEQTSVKIHHCSERINLQTQKINRERYRVNNIEERLNTRDPSQQPRRRTVFDEDQNN